MEMRARIGWLVSCVLCLHGSAVGCIDGIDRYATIDDCKWSSYGNQEKRCAIDINEYLK